ncbi:MAG: discoidin domain-containing protein, partial [Gemmatimonadetes bacterium]|nr:discoidin domain-containing protein [Gemmatimonadota bacterium]
MWNHFVRTAVWIALAAGALAAAVPAAPTQLESGFAAPPRHAGTWIYWWWFNGYVSEEGIVRDLDEMSDKGISGALVFHAGTGPSPKSTEFMTPPWKERFRFAVEEAARRDITISLNLCGGWNAGGPWVTAEHAPRLLCHEVLGVKGPSNLEQIWPPPEKQKYYAALFTLAWKLEDGACRTDSLVDLTGNLREGRIAWTVPPGEWRIVRFGTHVSERAFTKCTGGARYPEIDPLSRAAMDLHFKHTVEAVVQDIRPLVGKTFTHVHIDSGEIGNPDWTARFPEHFERLRGYDAIPYLAAKAGLTVESPEITRRFLEDYERTIGDLMIECYYGYLGELAARYGLKTHSEAAGFQKPTVNALRSLGCNDIAMSEFWSHRGPGYIHQLAEDQLRNHDGIKTAASAAHAYGRAIVQAEAFTLTGAPQFARSLRDLKDVGDRAFCQGLNRMVLHHFFHQPESDDRAPGYVWPGVGIEFSRLATWWPLSRSWFSYLNRCHYLLQEGRFTADVCYFQGEWIPAYVPATWAMDPPLPAGYDCDTIDVSTLLERMTVGDDGRLLLPGRMSYRYLVLWQGGPWRNVRRAPTPAGESVAERYPAAGTGTPLALSPRTLRRIRELVEAGATLVGPPPDRAIGLAEYPRSDAAVRDLAAALWGEAPVSLPKPAITASSFQTYRGNRYPAAHAADGDPSTFWVSGGIEPGEGPTEAHPEWLQLTVEKPRPMRQVTILPKAGYGPRRAELHISPDGESFTAFRSLDMDGRTPVTVALPEAPIRAVRLRITGTWARQDRNVQISEFSIDAAPLAPGERRVGKGRVIWGRSLADILRDDGVPPDLEIRESPETRALPPQTLSDIPHPSSFDWIHRKIEDGDFYFVANLRNAPAAGTFTFRIGGRQPELWDPLSGRIRVLP